VVLTLLLCAVPELLGAEEWQVRRQGHFIIHTVPRPQDELERFMEQFEAQYQRVSNLLGFSPVQPIPIYLYSDRSAFLRDVRGIGTEGVVGVAYGHNGVVRLDATGLYAPPAEVLRHELLHAFLFSRLGARTDELPLWFNEGLAQHAANPAPWDVDETLARALGEGSITSLGQLKDRFPPGKEGVAYAESQNVVEFLLPRLGPKGLNRLLLSVASGEPFARALKATSGLTIFELERQWSAKLSREHRLDWINTLVWPGVGVAFLVAGALAYASVQRKRRRIVQEDWGPEDEQFEEPD
jgi:hypothetical protein